MDFYPVKKITTAEVRINHHHHSHIDSKRSGEAEPPLNNLKREGDEKIHADIFSLNQATRVSSPLQCGHTCWSSEESHTEEKVH